MRYLLLIFMLAGIQTVAQAQPVPRLKMADVVKMYSQPSDTVYVINFWATFCKPCVAEIPDFIRICDQYAGQKVKLLLVSLDLKEDYPVTIRSFAQKRHFNTNIAWLNETNADVFCPMIDKSWSGAIPATLMVNARSGCKKFFEGEMKAAAFEMMLKETMNH
ncbi:MAG: TlpA family protein disulfide reductase [Ferruginibacter sp.]